MNAPGSVASRLSTVAFTAVVIALGFMLQDPLQPEFRINVVFMLAVFPVPALALRRPADVLARWGPLLTLSVLGTFAWDVATAFIAGSRAFLSEWYIVYLAGPVTLMALFFLHAFIAHRLAITIEGDRES